MAIASSPFFSSTPSPLSVHGGTASCKFVVMNSARGALLPTAIRISDSRSLMAHEVSAVSAGPCIFSVHAALTCAHATRCETGIEDNSDWKLVRDRAQARGKRMQDEQRQYVYSGRDDEYRRVAADAIQHPAGVFRH